MTSVVCLGIATLMAGVEVTINNAFGASDLRPFFLWTLPFAAIIALIKEKSAKSFCRLPVLQKYAVTGGIGIVSGVLWTHVVASFFGPWFGAFSFPVLSCWVVSGASGMMVGLGSCDGTRQSMLLDLVIIVVMCLSALFVSKPAAVFLTGEQELEVVSVKWQPGPQPLTNDEVLGRSLSPRDLERLSAIGLTGHVAYSGSGRYGDGQHARVLIVMQRPLTEPVYLPQPDGVEVIYVQGDHEWKMYPPTARTLQRSIHLWTDQGGTIGATRYSVERADGSKQGGTLFSW